MGSLGDESSRNALKDEKGIESEYYRVRVLEIRLVPTRVRTQQRKKLWPVVPKVLNVTI